MNLLPVHTLEHSKRVSSLAYTIYPKHYSQYVEMDNILYFLDNHQTPQCIFSEVEKGIQYSLIQENNVDIGYLAIEHKDDCLHLYKIYLLEKARGKGLGKFAMDWIINEAKKSKSSNIELIVNQNNKGSIDFYQSYGFEIKEAYDQHYSEDFVNQDYKMVKVLY